MGRNTATIEKMQTQLNEWNAQIKLLEAKIESSKSDVKLQRASMINQLRTKQRAANENIREMKQATNDSWDEVKISADKTWEDLKAGIAKAHSNIAL